MEKFTKQRKPQGDLELRDNQHLYQNQLKFDNNIYFTNQQNKSMNQTRSNQNLANQSGVSYGLTHSLSADLSQKQLLSNHIKETTVSYSFLLSAIFLLTISLLSIAITFIFPFWIELSFRNLTSSDPLTTVNITNTATNITLISKNRTQDESIMFNLGIWEVKMHQVLEFYDKKSFLTYKNSYPLSMLWISSDQNNQVQSFLMKLVDFINLHNVNIFTIQILEILHLIFTFLTLCFTSFTLCLCTTHKSSLCWYLVCFLMCLIGFVTGLVVIILIVVWQAQPLQDLRDDALNQIGFVKSFNWCFWFAVGATCAILLAAILILVYVLISTMIMFNIEKEKKRMSFDAPFIVEPEVSRIRLPRFPPNSLRNATAMSPEHEARIARSVLQLQEQSKAANPSYIFYTGHGNYRRTSIDLDEMRTDYDQADVSGGNLISQSFVSQRLNNSNEHNYSNVEHAHNEFKYFK